MYALTGSTEGDCYLCVPPDPGIAAAALGASESALSGTAPAEALHTFTLDSSASRCFFRDNTTVTPLPAPVAVSLADPSGGPVLARSSTVLPCPAVPSGSLTGLHLPSLSTNFVSNAILQDAWVETLTPGGQRLAICTYAWTGRHLAMFTRRPGSSLYTLTTEPSDVDASGQVSAPGQVAAPCSCRQLSHQIVLWHHRLGHPSLLRLRSMHSRLLVSGLPRSLPPLPRSPAPPCLPCVEGRQHAAPHSSSFPPTEAPLQTLHMDVWGPARVQGQGRERYFLLVVDDYTRYTTVFPLRSKGEVPDVLIPWIRAVRLQLHERFHTNLLVLCLHSDRGGSRAFVRDTSADKLSSRTIPCVFLGFPPDAPGWQFYHPTSRRVLSSQDVTFDESVPFYHLFPYRTALPSSPPPPAALPRSRSPSGRSSPPSGSCSFSLGVLSLSVRSLGVLSLRVRSLGVLSVSVRSLGVLSLSVWSLGVLSMRVLSLSVWSLGLLSLGVLRLGVLLLHPESLSRCASGTLSSSAFKVALLELEALELLIMEVLVLEVLELPELVVLPVLGDAGTVGPGGARTGGTRSALSPQQLHKWYAQRCRLRSGVALAGGDAAGGAGAGGAGAGGTGAGGLGAGAAGPRGANTGGTGAVEAGGAAGARGAGGTSIAGPGGARTGGAGAAGASGAAGSGVGGAGAGGAGAGGTGAGGAGARGAGAGGSGAAGGAGAAGTGGAGAGGTGAGGTAQPRLIFAPPSPSSLPLPDSVIRQVLSLPSSTGLPLQPGSPLPAPSPYTEQIDSLTERCEPASRPASPVRAVRTGRRVPRQRPPPFRDTHTMTLRPSYVPHRVPLPSPCESSLPHVPDPESDLVRAASQTVTRLLATIVTDPSFESTAASALVAELVDFAAACRLDYAASLVAESESVCPPSVEGECALGTDVLEDSQEDFECLAAVVPHLVAMLLAPEGDSDALDIPTRALTQKRLQVPTPLSGRQPWMQRWHPGSPQALTLTQFPLLGRT
ncbi:unnamed protein product [Closterium sp. Yama58-4]|nr:unnamed protein product [Closterium sp. Yama58-4]